VELYLKKVHRDSGFSMETLYDSLGGKPAGTPTQQPSSSGGGLIKKFESVNERAIIAVLLEHPEFQESAKQVQEDYFFSPAYRKLFKTITESKDKLELHKLLQVFEGDEDCCAALSAVGIEQTVFGDPESYFKDCCLKLKMEFLKNRREELKEQLTVLSAGGAADKDKLIQTAQEITGIDLELKNIKSRF